MLRAPVKAGEIGVKAQKEDGLQSQDRRPSVSSIPFRPSLNLSLSSYPPSVSSASLRLLRMQVKIGVSRNV